VRRGLALYDVVIDGAVLDLLVGTSHQPRNPEPTIHLAALIKKKRIGYRKRSGLMSGTIKN
jgi:hypothetical protein